MTESATNNNLRFSNCSPSSTRKLWRASRISFRGVLCAPDRSEASLSLDSERFRSQHRSYFLDSDLLSTQPVIEVVGESPEVIRLKERLTAQEGAIREMNRKLDENNAAAATSEAVPTSEAAAASEPSATSEAATTSEAAATSAAAAELVRLRERTAVARLRERLGQQEGAVLRELGAH
jgi:hypothetical protein